MREPLVSVIIPYYKNIIFFPKTIKSVLSQSYKNIEIIIIYDDENLEDLKKIKNLKIKKKIKIIINKKNIGAGESRNIGIKKSKGKYLAFIDSDDIWKKNKLKYQINCMKKMKVKITHTSYEIINDYDVKIGKQIAKKELNYSDLLKCCYIGTSTVVVKKELFKNIRFPKISTQEDYVTWLKISRSNKIYGLSKKLSFWRKSKNSLSNNITTKFINAFLVYYKYQKKNIFSSLISLIIMTCHSIKKKINNYF